MLPASVGEKRGLAGWLATSWLVWVAAEALYPSSFEAGFVSLTRLCLRLPTSHLSHHLSSVFHTEAAGTKTCQTPKLDMKIGARHTRSIYNAMPQPVNMKLHCRPADHTFVSLLLMNLSIIVSISQYVYSNDSPLLEFSLKKKRLKWPGFVSWFIPPVYLTIFSSCSIMFKHSLIFINHSCTH